MIDSLELLGDFENEDDEIPSTDIQLMRGITVSDSDWTVETILSQLGKGRISLNPRFQRRDAWDDKRKSRFIESLLLGIPIPQIVLAENPNAKGTYIVIDGKQRLLALQRFFNHSRPLDLKGLSVRVDLNGKNWIDIEQGEGWIDDSSALENATIRTTVIRGFRDERALYLIFHRLNSGSVALSPQELRHVLHPGPFIDFAFDFSQESPLFIELLGQEGEPDFRMRDVEVLIRFYGIHYFIEEYKGDLKDFLDTTVMKLNKEWAQSRDEIIEIAKNCERSIKLTIGIFGEEAFSKATRKGFEKRFNRAVFDIMTYYFSQPALQEYLKNDTGIHAAIKNSFQELCTEDEDFRRTLESTTKTVNATLIRLHRWGNKISTLLGWEVPGLQRIEKIKLEHRN